MSEIMKLEAIDRTMVHEEYLNETLSNISQKEDSKEDQYNVIVAIAGEYTSAMSSKNKEYLDVPIMDATGVYTMRVWDAVPSCKRGFLPGTVWTMAVKKGSWNGKAQITFARGHSVKIADKLNREIILEALEEYSRNMDDMTQEDKQIFNEDIGLYSRILNHVARIYEVGRDSIDSILSVRFRAIREDRTDVMDIHDHLFGFREGITGFTGTVKDLQDMCDQVRDLEPTFVSPQMEEAFMTYCEAPAAKSHHGAYIHGLLEHSVSLLNIVKSLEAMYGIDGTMAPARMFSITDREHPIDWLLLELCAIIHDYYKVDEYTWGELGNIDYTNDSQFDHSFMLTFRLQALKLASDLRTGETIDKVSQIILMHHGQWAEYTPGSRTEICKEAEIFNYIDLLDARIVGAMEG